ncbi:MAG: lipase family protein [Saccharofermentanales bacterium]
MFSKKRLEMDIRELQKSEPKYIGSRRIVQHKVPLPDRLAGLTNVIYIRPGDPWIVCNDNILQLPFPPEGCGISMVVCALPIVRLLGGGLRYHGAADQWEPCRRTLGTDRNDNDIDAANAGLVKLPLYEILVHLKMGVLISGNGSVYIGDRKELSRIDPPDLDDDYRLVLHPFRDEELFISDIITDEWGFQRNKYNRELAIRSLAFSKASYSMRIKPFIMDGWLDYTLIHEGKIKATEDDWNLEPSAAKKFISSIKQIIATQSAKAVVMGRPMSDGGAIINITFTGTKHTADWLNNIKVSVSHHLHKGFYELATQFDSVISQINLDRLAVALGLPELTLPQVIEEARKPGSRYKLWITGHSQGGALTQVYIAEFLIARGVLPANIFGYSFASPIVATAEYCRRPGDFPVYNIINTDDFATRVGSAVRLGVDMLYFPDPDFRIAHYAGYRDPLTRAKFDDILKLCYWMTDSFKFGEYMIAMTTFATEYPVAKGILEWIDETPILSKLYAAFRDRTDIPQVIHDRMYKMLEKPYMDVGGTPPSEERIIKIRSFLDILYKKWGADCIMDFTYETHQIPSNYAEIILLPEDKLIKAVWTSGSPARLMTGSGEELMTPIDFPDIDAGCSGDYSDPSD